MIEDSPAYPPPAPAQPAVELRGVSVMRGEREILRNVSWRVMPGDFAALLGPNGSGKSTIARMLCGYVWPTRGTVSVCGRTLGETDTAAMRENIRLVQAAGPFDAEPEATVLQVVASGGGGTIRGPLDISAELRRACRDRLELVGLAGRETAVYGTLSSGERVRTLLARATLRPADLLLLDEPTAGLDLAAREHWLAALRTLHAAPHRPTIILTTHHVEELPPETGPTLLLRDGAVVASGPASHVLGAETLSRAFGLPLAVDRSDGRWWVRIRPNAGGPASV